MPDILRASIVINNYNYGRFLAEAIESALAQTYDNTEVIVVDDGSTDDSREVIRQCPSQIISVFKENEGQASAYNKGFAVSHGDVVCFLDSDDTLSETAISQAISAFQDPHVTKVEWQLTIVDALGVDSGDVVPRKPMPEGDLRQLSILNGPFYDWWFTPPSSGNCYARRFLERAMPVPEASYRHGADVYLTILAPLYGEIRRLPEPQGTYRVHESNNYFGRSLDSSRLRDYVQRFENCCVHLQKHFGAQGVKVDIDNWKERNFNYLWPTRWFRAVSQIETVVSPGDSYLLVNNDDWGNSEPVRGRHAIPFLERDGQFWGPPANDDVAISQLNRLKAEAGISHIVFLWTAYWWLEHYPRFHSWLRSVHKCVLKNDALAVFDVRQGDNHIFNE